MTANLIKIFHLYSLCLPVILFTYQFLLTPFAQADQRTARVGNFDM